uniref:Uncharacterized protein n=1 Tax=Heterorhabditis bacteriophora TaxID=37862 RepID=A0A1I7WK05_HETBA
MNASLDLFFNNVISYNENENETIDNTRRNKNKSKETMSVDSPSLVIRDMSPLMDYINSVHVRSFCVTAQIE